MLTKTFNQLQIRLQIYFFENKKIKIFKMDMIVTRRIITIEKSLGIYS